jgi:hypothetical protein
MKQKPVKLAFWIMFIAFVVSLVIPYLRSYVKPIYNVSIYCERSSAVQDQQIDELQFITTIEEGGAFSYFGCEDKGAIYFSRLNGSGAFKFTQERGNYEFESLLEEDWSHFYGTIHIEIAK